MRGLLAVFRAQARYWTRHKLQALLCLVGVLLGVAVFTAIRLANQGALDAFAQGVQAFAGKATHRVYDPSGAGLPDALFRTLADAPAVRAATPVLEGRMRVTAPDGERLSVVVRGIDPVSDAPFRDFSFLGRARPGPGSGDAASLLDRFLAEPDALLLPQPLARRLGVAPGDALRAETGHGPRTFRVLGVFALPEGRGQAFSRTAVADVAAVQEQFGRLGRLDAINLIVPRGQEARVRALLPPNVRLEPIGVRTERVERMSRAFRLNLEALALFALLVAIFLIFNAATFGVVQREPSIAVLRCIGAPARTVFGALLGESVVLGLLGGAGGVLAGRWLGALMLRNTGTTLFEVVLNTHPLPATVHPDGVSWAIGLALGVGASTLGALRPAVEGARVSPLAALSGARMPRQRRAPLRGWLLIGVGGLGLAALLSWWPAGSLLGGIAGATALALGGAALCPPALALVSRGLAGPLAALFGPAGRLAARNLGRSLGRTGLAAASLMVALALALSIEITVRSFKRTFEVWLTQWVTADLYLRPAALNGAGSFPQALIPELRALPFVRAFAGLKTRRVVVGQREVLVLALDLPAFAETSTLPAKGVSQAEAFRGLAAGGAFVSETLAYPLGLRRGGRITLPTPHGPRSFPIAAVVQNYSTPQGVVYLEKRHYVQAFGPQPTQRVAIWLKPGTSLDAAMRAVEALPGAGALTLVPNRALRGEALRVFDRTFAITELMGGLAALVAFIAVVSALTALLEERTRTLGFLRAIGISRRRLGLSLGLEAGLLALTAALVSWGVGLLMAMVLVFVINRRAFGWTLQFLPGQGRYGTLLALALAAALLGSVYPVWRAARRSITATIRDE